MSFARIPDPHFKTLADVEDWARDTQRALQSAIDVLATVSGTGYLAKNFTATRVLDASSAGLGDVVQTLCTLIDDLKRGKQGTTLG